MDFRVKNVMNVWSDYLAIPNNLLLSHRRTVAYTSQKQFSRARVALCAPPIGRRIPRNPSPEIVVSVGQSL